jgi:REP element-mobilizing transposase RayT
MPAGLQRIYVRGHLHFITFRCYRRLPLLNNACARDIFVTELGELRDEMGFQLVGYVVMPEHVHLLLSEPPRGTPSTVMQKLKLRVVRKLRRRTASVGQLSLRWMIERREISLYASRPIRPARTSGASRKRMGKKKSACSVRNDGVAGCSGVRDRVSTKTQVQKANLGHSPRYFGL